MSRSFRILAAVAVWLCTAAAAGDERAPAAPQTPAAPIARPARLLPHAAQAGLLASTRADTRLVAVGDRGVVMLSDDGRTFRQARGVPVDVTLTGVSFVDALHGWAVGHWGVVLATRDGGETWHVQRQDVQEDRPLFAVHFFDAQHGVAVGLWSLVLVTDDGGATWRSVSLSPPQGAKKADLNLLGLFADDRGRLFAPAERGMVLMSDDRGATWSYASTGYTGSLWSGLAMPGGTVLVGGLRGSLYRSTDRGITWARIDTSSKSSITAMARQGSSVVAVGLDGVVLRSVDSGAAFKGDERPDRAALTSVATAADGRTVFFSRRGVLKDSAEPPGR